MIGLEERQNPLRYHQKRKKSIRSSAAAVALRRPRVIV